MRLYWQYDCGCCAPTAGCFLAIARIALADNLQLLEQLGVPDNKKRRT
jgi:hypothetical protein